MKLTAAFLATAIAGTSTAPSAAQPFEPGFIRIDDDIILRRAVVRNEHAKGAVLLLHGFPETILSFKGIALTLGDDYEVHTFDWPGFGQSSRPRRIGSPTHRPTTRVS